MMPRSACFFGTVNVALLPDTHLSCRKVTLCSLWLLHWLAMMGSR